MVYDFLLPSIPILGGYFYTYGLYKKKLIRKALHVNFWNFLLMVTFLISGGAGFLLLIAIDQGIILPFSLEMLYWHVEVGISMLIVTLFHFHSHWKSVLEMVFLKRRRTA
ncbi:MAG TPA: hypothetical protein VK444_03580 [Methanobacteriaceae archaeon]|nr:hypothetical protein [Methanobacteriaceae archaeon]